MVSFENWSPTGDWHNIYIPTEDLCIDSLAQPCQPLWRYMLNFSDWILWHKFTVGILDLSIDMQDTWSLLDCARNELGSVRTFLVSRFTVFFYVTFLCWSFSNSFGGKQAVLWYDFRVEGKPHNCLDDAIVPMRLVLHRLEHGLEGMILLNPRG